jgi:hypothetical protein
MAIASHRFRPGRNLSRAVGFGSAASKPAPFAEKKIAKDAAPANSILDVPVRTLGVKMNSGVM